MNPHHTYAFYGSLRRGMKYYEQFKQDLDYRFSFWLKNYALYSLGPYPCAVQSSHPESKILIEVMHVKSEKTEQAIHQIEMDAGYYFQNILIHGQSVGIYLYADASNYTLVQSGDWVTFFGQ